MTNSESNYVAIIREICAEEGIELQSFSFDWIFRLTKNGKTGFILGYQFGRPSRSSSGTAVSWRSFSRC